VLPYARPGIGDAEIEEVVACLRSGWLSTGPRVARFERELAAYLGVPHVLATSSGTAALHLALLAAGVGPGDEVVTTPITWVATANVILHAGARPVFADVERDTLNLDPERVAEVLSGRTRAILPVHFAGLPCDEDALLSIARERGVPLVEDAAHALGARYRGRPIGAIGDLTMFSFHPAKNLTTGEGGALALHSDEAAARARRLRYHGIEQGPESRFGGRGPASYAAVEAGFKYNMSDLQAAIGIPQLERLERANARRRELAAAYRERLAAVPHVRPLADAPPDRLHACHLMVVELEIEALRIERDGVIAALRDRGVGAGLHFVPLHEQPLYRPFAEASRLEVASDAGRRILTLPLFPEMRDEDVALVVDALAAVLRGGERAGAAARLAGEAP